MCTPFIPVFRAEHNIFNHTSGVVEGVLGVLFGLGLELFSSNLSLF